MIETDRKDAGATGTDGTDPGGTRAATIDFRKIQEAAARIAPHAHVTPVLHSTSLDALAGCELQFKCENFQRAGAFKFRGACNAVWSLSDAQAKRGVVTHSSGNHGAALALAAHDRGIPAHVIVPEGAVASKLAAIRAYGATLHPCAPTMAAREAACARVQAQTGAELVHPFTDPRVIAGQGTAALELLYAAPWLDALIAPIGGGGLIGGSAVVGRAQSRPMQIFAAEPAGAADAFESLRQGRRVTDVVPQTIADGLRGTLGAINLELLLRHRVDVLLVDEDEIVAAMRLLSARLKIVIEPSSATVFAAILRYREHFAGKRVGVIVSGGNSGD
jgi:threonine dehydratase